MPKRIKAAAKPKRLIAIAAPVTVTAAKAEGDSKGVAKFESTFYTGGALEIEYWDLPVVIDLEGLDNAKVLVANLDHVTSQRVGNFEVTNDGKTLVANGSATAVTPAAAEVVQSAANGYQWQASLEVTPRAIEEVPANKTIEVNGQTFTGPIYVTRQGTLKGFAFVSHGADDNTDATIAASRAASSKEQKMKPEIKAWAEKMGVVVDEANEDQVATIEVNYAGQNGAKPAKTNKAGDPFEEARSEAKRRGEIEAMGKQYCSRRDPQDLEFIESMSKMVQHAIDTKMTVQDFRIEAGESMFPMAHTVVAPRRGRGLTNRVVEAAVCQTLRLPNVETLYDDQTLQASHDHFKGRIGLKQLLLIAAEQNGCTSNYSSDISREVMEAAFPERKYRQIKAQGWSTIEISSILSNVAGKFVREGFMSIEDTWSRISTVRSVSDFKQITTVSLVGDLNFEKLGAAGEIKHGTLGEVVYTGKVDTYAKMLAITRQDIINDDLGALSAAPRRLGRGSASKLNDIFWTAFLYGETSGFFSATHTAVGNTGNSNLNSGAADVTIAGLTATELLFLNQVDPNGLPLGVMPKIVLVPNALKAAMSALLHPQSQLITGASATLSNVNVFAGRFQLENSSYMANASYTGYDPAKWYMLADPNDLCAIEIQALNGRVEPTVESADADFNTLGIQIRAYGDVGVSLQEFRAAVKADGGSS